jgi:uncharacterized protein YrrD
MTSMRAARGLPVVAKDSARKLGEVDQFVVDPQTHSIRALDVQPGRKTGFVSWTDIAAFGEDAVMVPGEDRVHGAEDEAMEQAARADHAMLDKLVLSEEGNACGEVSDVQFDPASGTIETVTVGSDEIEGGRLLGVGSFAVVISKGGG